MRWFVAGSASDPVGPARTSGASGFRTRRTRIRRNADPARNTRRASIDKFVGRVELTRWLEAADVFVTPYPNLDQIVSGTLSYAMSAGRAIVSTPYAYAAELLTEGRGILVAPGFADQVRRGAQPGAGRRRAARRHRPARLCLQPEHGLVGGRRRLSTPLRTGRRAGVGRCSFGAAGDHQCLRPARGRHPRTGPRAAPPGLSPLFPVVREHLDLADRPVRGPTARDRLEAGPGPRLLHRRRRSRARGRPAPRPDARLGRRLGAGLAERPLPARRLRPRRRDVPQLPARRRLVDRRHPRRRTARAARCSPSATVVATSPDGRMVALAAFALPPMPCRRRSA